MRKKMLSLALALVMCLGLTVPALAAESELKLAVSGKTDAQVFVGEKTFTVRDWEFKSSDYDEEDMPYSIWAKTDSRKYTAENLCVMAKGDIAVFSKGGETFRYLDVTAWSDPDGDGVYDMRLATDFDFIVPADTDGTVSGNGTTTLAFYMPDPKYGFAPSEYGAFELDFMSYGYASVTELKMPADYLLDLYGPNTLIVVEERNYNENGYAVDWSCAILVEGNAAQPSQPTAPSFSDVKADAFYAEPVAWAVEKGITAGASATAFSPNATCTQGQILTFLWRAKGEPKPTGTVSGTQYYATAAQWAREQGLTDNFSAEADCTRAMVVTYLWKLAGSPKAGTSNFSDVSANADYAQAVAWAVEQGITSGTSATTFSPDMACTRGQIVTFLYWAFAK